MAAGGSMDKTLPKEQTLNPNMIKLATSVMRIFITKSDVMIHKKNKYGEKVPFCKDFKNGSCTFSRCWYRHEEITEINSHKETSTEKSPTISSRVDFPPVGNQ